MTYTWEFDRQTGHPLWRRVARNLVPAGVRRRVGTWFGEIRIDRRPDRIYLTRELIPAVARRGGKLLFVGCRRYTKNYPALFGAHGADCWTIDVDLSVARWGAPEQHVVGDILDALDYWSPATFDTIVLNGVFGFGLNAMRDQDAALRVCRHLLTADGRLILGWNTDRCVEPSELSAVRSHYQPSSLSGLARHQAFAKSAHVFDTFTVGDPVGPQIRR
jgi:hypothetical protein